MTAMKRAVFIIERYGSFSKILHDIFSEIFDWDEQFSEFKALKNFSYKS